MRTSVAEEAECIACEYGSLPYRSATRPGAGLPLRVPSRAGNVARTPDLLEQIEAVLRELAPPSVVSAARLVTDDDERELYPAERDAIRRAVPSRRRQFATGRALLRQLLGHRVSIPVAADRRPVLPPGVTASLAHDDEVAVAVATADPRFTGLGVDIERIAAVTPDLATSILRPDDGTADVAMAFVIKEAAYKAWSRPDRPILDHHEVHLMVGGGGTVIATVLPTGGRVPVNVAQVACRWLAVAVVASEDGDTFVANRVEGGDGLATALILTAVDDFDKRAQEEVVQRPEEDDQIEGQ
jgi:4'-phosphopantetheinyl transferase EntD